jgi:sugar/nucleoside kinase (ribokinase family)
VSEKIACIGNVTQDSLLYVNGLPELDDVGYVNRGVDCLGGRGGIVALTLAQVVDRVDLITVFPSGNEAQSARAFLEDNNVATQGVSVDERATAMHKVYVALSAEDRNCISFFRPGDVTFDATDEQRRIAADAGTAYFSTHKRSFNRQLLDSIDPTQTKIIHNVASYLSQDDAYREDMLQNSHVLICNEQEAATLCEASRVDRADALFARSGILQSIVVTYGEQGSVVYDRDGDPQRFGIEKCLVEAPVGAGDAYAAGIVYGVSSEWPMARSVNLAKRLSALSVSSRTSYPNLEQVAKIVEEA